MQRSGSEVGIHKRKQENKNSTKKAIKKTSKKKENTNSFKKTGQKERKQELDQESD